MFGINDDFASLASHIGEYESRTLLYFYHIVAVDVSSRALRGTLHKHAYAYERFAVGGLGYRT